jgi:hypothetical protein
MVAEPRLVFPEYGFFQTEKVERPAYCFALDEQDGSAVLHLPYFAPGPHLYDWYALLCDRALVNSSVGAPPPVGIPSPAANAQAKLGFLRYLSDHGIRFIVVHKSFYDYLANHQGVHEPSLGPRSRGFRGSDVESWLGQYLGPPASFPDSGVRVYLVEARDPQIWR